MTCNQGFTSTAGNTATSCTVCDQGKASTAAGAGCITVTNASPAANLANCRVFGEAGATTCVVAKDGFTVSSNLPVPCAAGEWSANGSACAAVTTVPTSGNLVNCRTFSEAAATNCKVA